MSTKFPTNFQQGVNLFIKKIERLAPEKSTPEKFRDFCEMAYCALAKLTAPSVERADNLEERYMKIVHTYRNKDDVRAMPELLAMVEWYVADMYEDFLGAVAGEIGALSAHGGQFFTPGSVARIMAEIDIETTIKCIDENGFVAANDPCVGAGVTILKLAEVLRYRGYNPTIHMLVHATDISILAYHMCFIQFNYADIPAGVIRGNSLSLEQYESAWTLPALVFRDYHGHLDNSKPGRNPKKDEARLLQFVNAVRALEGLPPKSADSTPTEAEPEPKAVDYETDPRGIPINLGDTIFCTTHKALGIVHDRLAIDDTYQYIIHPLSAGDPFMSYADSIYVQSDDSQSESITEHSSHVSIAFHEDSAYFAGQRIRHIRTNTEGIIKRALPHQLDVLLDDGTAMQLSPKHIEPLYKEETTLSPMNIRSNSPSDEPPRTTQLTLFG